MCFDLATFIVAHAWDLLYTSIQTTNEFPMQ
jgi:hypothetical protein